MTVYENNFFRQATLRICGNLDFEISLQQCLKYLKSFMPADRFHLNLYDRGLTAIKTIAIVSLKKAERVNIIFPLDKNGQKYIDDPNLPPALIVNRPLMHPLARPIVQRVRERKDYSALVMHLAIEGAKLGNLILFAKGNNQYTEDHLRLFSTLMSL